MPRPVAFEALDSFSIISLTTFRKNGTPVATPVTYAQYNDKLYVITGAKTGKIKRLHYNQQVEIAPCDHRGTLLGEPFKAQARIAPNAEIQNFKSKLRFKAPAPLMFIFNRLRDLRSGGNVYLEITLS